MMANIQGEVTILMNDDTGIKQSSLDLRKLRSYDVTGRISAEATKGNGRRKTEVEES